MAITPARVWQPKALVWDESVMSTWNKMCSSTAAIVCQVRGIEAGGTIPLPNAWNDHTLVRLNETLMLFYFIVLGAFGGGNFAFCICLCRYCKQNVDNKT
ncbi:hypothetical protein SLE2022_050460 [Rubroshorea leprosula]